MASTSKVPSDWPASGAIDLAVHELPHASSTLEWWYVNGHCTGRDGHRYSLFAAFFRKVSGRDPKTGAFQHAHSVTWGIADVDAGEVRHVSRVDRSAPAEGLKRIRRGLGSKDSRINRAMAEVFERGSLPLPDRLFEGDVVVGEKKLELRFGNDAAFFKEGANYRLVLKDDKKGIGCDLVIEPQKPPIRHGDDGVVRGSDDESMFYYFIPRCRLTGSLTFADKKHEIASGQAWHDHEFGVAEVEDVDDAAEARLPEPQRLAIHEKRRQRWQDHQVSWDWLSAQLEDGTEVAIYQEWYFNNNKPAGEWAVLIGPKGARELHKGIEFRQTRLWRSVRTFSIYPTAYRVLVPSAGIDLEVKAAFEDQEFITLLSKPSFWEGRVEVSGTVKGKPVRGIGFIERAGFATYDDMESFFEEVGKVVRESVERVIPMKPTWEQARDLITSKGRDQYMQGVDLEQYARTHIHPIREIVDRGGKGWRSYAAVACIDIVGGDSRHFIEWIALPELMHVGSLIVDDVQDKSETRRGGKTAHLIYGESQAINAGTAAYFIGNQLVRDEFLSKADVVRVYRLYFDALRAGHAGQAIDLDGFEYMMARVIETGEAQALEDRVLAVHRLKTAAPAGCLARIGGVCGGGSEEQIEGVGLFFEALGLAFQIIDDVLNLRGFKGELKERAEDIVQGKVTLPVAKALGRLPLAERKWLYETLHSKPTDPRVVESVVKKLDDCGAIDACVEQARGLIETGWKGFAPLVDDSLTKVMLRGFGWYVLERHY